MKISPYFSLTPLLLVIGCSGGGSGSGYVPTPTPAIEPAAVAAGQEQSLFPFKEGNSWTYTIKTVIRAGTTVNQGTQEATFKVAKTEVKDGNTRATLEMSINGKVMDRQIWLSNSKGIYQISIGTTPTRTFSTPIPSISFPVTAGRKFSWSGSDGKSQMAYSNVIVGPQEVDTEEKRLSAIAVDTKGTSINGKVTEKTDRTIWFAPGVGMVRVRESTVSSKGASELQLSLKSHTVK